jgi:hypothetical protein
MAAPIFDSSAIQQQGPDFVDVSFSVDQDAKVWAIAQDAAQVAPDAAEIQGALSGDGVTAAESANATGGYINGGGAYSLRLEGLNADGTNIDVYLVAQNAASEDSLVEEVVTALTIPAISDPAPAGSFDPYTPPTPSGPAFGTTLPDATVDSNVSNWQNRFVGKPWAETTGDNQITLNFEVDSVAGLTSPTYTIKLFGAGVWPADDAAAIDTPDVAATALTIGAKAIVIPGTADETGYWIALSFNSTETGQYTVWPTGIVWSTL